MKPGYNRSISLSAAVALAGFVLSGPVAFIAVKLIKPQPAWVSPAVFAENYSTLQDLPYYFGFLLIGGMLMLVAGHYLNYKGDDKKVKFHLQLSLGWTIVFCTLISINYICQTTFVHNMALHYEPAHDTAIAAFTMSNPMSFCWANEMWGYSFLGIATLLMSGYYRERNNTIRILLISNGILSLLSTAWTIADITWVMGTPGLVLYFVWNLLMIVLIIKIYLHSKKYEQ